MQQQNGENQYIKRQTLEDHLNKMFISNACVVRAYLPRPPPAFTVSTYEARRLVVRVVAKEQNIDATTERRHSEQLSV